MRMLKRIAVKILSRVAFAAMLITVLAIVSVKTLSPDSSADATETAVSSGSYMPQVDYDVDAGHSIEAQDCTGAGSFMGNEGPESEPHGNCDARLTEQDGSGGIRQAVSCDSPESESMIRTAPADTPRNPAASQAVSVQPTNSQAEVGDTSASTPSDWTGASTVAWINGVRADAGLPALSTHHIVTEAAQIRADESRVAFSHTRPCGNGFLSAFNDLGYRQGRGSETIAHVSPASWLSSPEHYGILTSPAMTHVGVGISGSNFVAIFTIGEPSVAPVASTETTQAAAPPPADVQAPQQENAAQPEQVPQPVTGFDCPLPYYLCYCIPGSPCSP